MKVREKLDEIKALVGVARALPMSSSIVVNKAELVRLLDELAGLLPEELAEAQAVLSRRDAVLYDASVNAERLLAAAEEERQQMVSEEEVLREAQIEAAEVIRSAKERSEQMSREVDEYVDAKLAHFEVSVTNILDTVRQGRQRLAEPGLYGELAALREPVPEPARPGDRWTPELQQRSLVVGSDGEPGQPAAARDEPTEEPSGDATVGDVQVAGASAGRAAAEQTRAE